MPQRPRWNVSVPEVDIPTYLFGDPTTPPGDALAFADAEDPETLSMTWTELRLWSQRLAAGLQAAGLEEGDQVLLLSGNNVMFPVINLGVIMASGIYQSANPHSNARELAYQFKLTTPHFILASQETLICALEAAKMSTTVYMIMTSGTTGLPKAAEVSHYGILANCVQTDFVMSLDPNLRTK
ncbi:hypothetical protein RU639_005091 [Aspergillus parasiticus]